MTQDPGVVRPKHFIRPLETYEREGPKRWGNVKHEVLPPLLCRVESCGALKVPGVHHCSTCKRCVYQMDHHCIWTGNCIGRGNLKFFYLFCLYTTLQILVGILIIIRNKLYYSDLYRLNGLNINPIGIMIHY